MKKAVAYLMPFMEAEKAQRAAAGQRGAQPGHGSRGTCHAHWQNIVGVVLACKKTMESHPHGRHGVCEKHV